MFDIGFSEIIVIIIVACIVLDIKDISKVIKALKKFIRFSNEMVDEVKKIFDNLDQEGRKIIDLEGNEQITYDLDDITPDIKDSKNEKN